MQNLLHCLDVITVERFNVKFTYEEFRIAGRYDCTLTTPCCFSQLLARWSGQRLGLGDSGTFCES